MASMDSSSAFIKEYQERFEKKLKENEIIFWNTGKLNWIK